MMIHIIVIHIFFTVWVIQCANIGIKGNYKSTLIFAVTGWTLCAIPHIRKGAKDHSDSYHSKQVNNVINTLFYGASEEEMAVTIDLFWT